MFEHTDTVREGRPTGKRFGVLVHAVLAEIDLNADAAAIAVAAEAHGRLLGASAADVRAAALAARDALAHPAVRRAAASESRREVPVMRRMPDGSLLEGIVDMAFRDADASGPLWTVVDFKTDAEFTGRYAKYAAQVRFYMEAIAEASGERTRGLLLSV